LGKLLLAEPGLQDNLTVRYDNQSQLQATIAPDYSWHKYQFQPKVKMAHTLL